MTVLHDPPELEEVHVATADGVDIACFVAGDGPSLMYMAAPPFVDTRALWRSTALINNSAAPLLVRHRRVIQFDPRGCGASQRNIVDHSLDARVRDVAAVMDRFAPEPVPLVALVSSAPVAVAYAATHPDRVSHLVLIDAYAYGPDFYAHPQIKAMLALRDHDWEFYTETVANGLAGWSGDKLVREMAQLFRKATSAETVQRYFDTEMHTDVRPLLPRIAAPTLVLKSARVPFLATHVAEGIASEIPNARLRVVDTTWGPGFDMATLASVMSDFIGDPPVHAASVNERAREAQPATSTAIVLFTDIADSTALTERMGDAAFRAAARAFDERVRAAMRECSGTPVEGKVLGDGVMAVFPSAAQAIEAARRCVALSAESELRLHVGLHAGDVIREDDNVYGGAVNIAARICGLSAPGEILVSATIRDLARTSAGAAFADCGEQALKGIEEPVRVWAVRAEGS